MPKINLLKNWRVSEADMSISTLPESIWDPLQEDDCSLPLLQRLSITSKVHSPYRRSPLELVLGIFKSCSNTSRQRTSAAAKETPINNSLCLKAWPKTKYYQILKTIHIKEKYQTDPWKGEVIRGSKRSFKQLKHACPKLLKIITFFKLWKMKKNFGRWFSRFKNKDF